MNAALQTLLIAAASVASAAAIGVSLAERTATPATEVVRLERVVVTGSHMATAAPAVVARLPRVVVERRRAAPADDFRLAQALPAAPAL
ncbi:hypothetical protein LXT12_10810 [Pelomonas sp. P7]|uniref:Pilus assembly protein FimV n=1 Tax=Pelomonas caseinilytica TaxID=2906763 RepID=A0ABS8XA05_9BURK|nr:hypothetical protein [Pelomonas sp. P7]MCE4537739.1 hypothetical protein [Pelomonas sp. P7]